MNTSQIKFVQLAAPFHVESFVAKSESVKKFLIAATKSNTINLRSINDEGDMDEEAQKVDLSNVIGLSIQTESGLAQVIRSGKGEDGDDDQDNATFVLFNFEELENGWVIGKLKKQVNDVVVDKPEYVIFKKNRLEFVQPSTDAYIDANMDWLVEMIVSDFEDMYPEQDTEEFDDGE